jgi:hypothetical protein
MPRPVVRHAHSGREAVKVTFNVGSKAKYRGAAGVAMEPAIVLAAAFASLTACSGDWIHNDSRAGDAKLQAAQELSEIECVGQTGCERVWRRTRDYVARQSATQIKRSDDSVIEIELPHEFGILYMWASKEPSLNDPNAWVVRLKVMCRGMYKSDGSPGWLYESCARQVEQVELGFRPYTTGEDIRGSVHLISVRTC